MSLGSTGKRAEGVEAALDACPVSAVLLCFFLEGRAPAWAGEAAGFGPVRKASVSLSAE